MCDTAELNLLLLPPQNILILFATRTSYMDGGEYTMLPKYTQYMIPQSVVGHLTTYRAAAHTTTTFQSRKGKQPQVGGGNREHDNNNRQAIVVISYH